MANAFSGVFGVVKEPVRRTDSLVVVRLVDRSYKGDPLYFDGELYDKLGETAERFLTPGKTVFFSGDLYLNTWKDKEYLRLRVNKMEFIDSSQGDKGGTSKAKTEKAVKVEALEPTVEGGDIPF